MIMAYTSVRLFTLPMIGIAIAEMMIIRRRVWRRPMRSEIAPERMRPVALPNAAMRSVRVAAVAGSPTLLANGTSWLIVKRPAAAPRQYPPHMGGDWLVVSAALALVPHVVARTFGCAPA